MSEMERFAWLQPAFTPYVGAENFLILLQYPSNMRAVLDTPAERIATLVRHKQAAEAWRNVEKRYLAQKSAEAALKWGTQDGCRLVLLQDRDFPEMLIQGITAPPVLFLHGNARLLHKYLAATVDSRHATPQAIQTAKDFDRMLSEKDIPVTSGMVSGISTTAHQDTLQTGSSTVAVWGMGINRVYPSSNKSSAYEATEKGLIISEFPLDTHPLTDSFPRRNRLVAVSSQVTPVVEATLESGPLTAAKLTAETGREVMTVPGSTDNSHNKGRHKLIKDDAKPVERPDDIMQECPQLLQNSPLLPYAVKRNTGETRRLEPSTTVGRPSENVGTEAGRQATSSPLPDTMGYDPVHPDTLAQQLQSPAADVYAELLELELGGEVASLVGRRYQRIEI